jgi:CheY-like chemotaxis protein
MISASHNMAGAPSVLIVEDEPLLLMLAAETMRDAGYDVFEAGEGKSALSILETNPGIDLLLSDIKMPGMNGYQLAEAGLALRPNLKVLLMTGYAQDPVPRQMTDAGVRVLYKPFDIDQLPSVAGEILSRKPAS